MRHRPPVDRYSASHGVRYLLFPAGLLCILGDTAIAGTPSVTHSISLLALPAPLHLLVPRLCNPCRPGNGYLSL